MHTIAWQPDPSGARAWRHGREWNIHDRVVVVSVVVWVVGGVEERELIVADETTPPDSRRFEQNQQVLFEARVG